MRVRMLTIALLLSTGLTVQSAQAQASKPMHATGATVRLDPTPVGSSTTVSLTVFRTNETGTFLLFEIFTGTPPFSSDTVGAGPIPNDLFAEHGAAGASLNVDLSKLGPSFQVEFCPVVGTCQFVTPTGVIQMDFKKNDMFFDSSVLEQHHESLAVDQTIHEDVRNSSATVNGTLLDFQLSDASGAIGTNRSTLITITLKH